MFHFSPTDVETLVLHPDNPTLHIHHKANSIGSGHASISLDYLRAVADSVSDAGSPPDYRARQCKDRIGRIHPLADPKLAEVIAGVETVDHPTDAQLVAYASKYLKATDRMTQ